MAWQAAALHRYLNERSQVETDQQVEGASEAVTVDVGFDRERLRKFLAANPDIALTREQLRLALTLREDRFWKDVTEADALKDALETGDATAFAAALEGRSAEEREAATARSVRYVEESVAYRRVAVRALDAVVVEAQSNSALAERLHRAAVAALGEADAELLASLTRPAVEFVFGQRREAGEQEKVRASLVTAIKGTTGQPITSLVLAARLVAALLDTPDLEAARERFATATLDEQAPIFEDPPNQLLAEGPVVTALFDSLGSWTPAATGQDQTVPRAERLIALAKAGWDGQTPIAALATKLLPQIPELTANADVLASLEAVTRLFAEAAPSTEFDQFGTQLAARRTVGDQEVFRYALRIPMQPPALAAVATEIQTWVQASTPAQIEPLLEIARERVEKALPAYRQVLLDLWESKGDVAYARLAVGGDPAKLGDVAAKWTALPPQSCLQLAAPGLDLTAEVGDRVAVEALIGGIVARVPAIPFANFTALPSVAGWLVRRNYERRSLALALETRIRTATTAADVQAIAPPSIAAAEHFGGRQRAGLAEALAEPFVNQNTGEPDQAAWLVDHLTTHNTRERLLVQLIERSLTLEPTLEAVQRAHTQFDSVQVFEALVSRAGREAEEAKADANLEAANFWSRPMPGSASDARASLDAVGVKFPGLKEKADQLLPAGSEESTS